MKHFLLGIIFVSSVFIFTACESSDDSTGPVNTPQTTRTASANYAGVAEFTASQSGSPGSVYEVLPGPAVMNPAMNPTPFSDNIQTTTGSYSFTVSDTDEDDSPSSQDAISDVTILFTGSDGTEYLIDKINIIHKAAGTGDHTFFGGVGRNKMMHGDTGIGIGLMPKMLAYITLWGLADLKNASDGSVIAANRVIHIMVATKARDANLKMIPSAVNDSSDHNTWNAETHIILPPQDMAGNADPVPGTAHGFLHMMFEQVALSGEARDWKLAYEILPGPAAVNPQMSPTPFSDRVAVGGGSFTLTTSDLTAGDSESSEDAVDNFTLFYERADGTAFSIDGINIIHKAEGTGDHTFFGGVGYDKEMHGDTGVGTNMMPKMLSYITLWGIVDLKDGNGNVLAADRLVHIMVSSRARTSDLKLITNLANDATDHSTQMIETHIILPPQDTQGNPDPVAGTGHGFLHLMFEKTTMN